MPPKKDPVSWAAAEFFRMLLLHSHCCLLTPKGKKESFFWFKGQEEELLTKAEMNLLRDKLFETLTQGLWRVTIEVTSSILDHKIEEAAKLANIDPDTILRMLPPYVKIESHSLRKNNSILSCVWSPSGQPMSLADFNRNHVCIHELHWVCQSETPVNPEYFPFRISRCPNCEKSLGPLKTMKPNIELLKLKHILESMDDHLLISVEDSEDSE